MLVAFPESKRIVFKLACPSLCAVGRCSLFTLNEMRLEMQAGNDVATLHKQLLDFRNVVQTVDGQKKVQTMRYTMPEVIHLITFDALIIICCAVMTS